MGGMDALMQFLRDRYDEDEQAAHAAIHADGRSWQVSGSHSDEGGTYWRIAAPTSGPSDVVELVGSGMSGGGVHTAAVAEHIARHDPARVLAEVDAKRQILELHSAMDSKGERITGCTTCSWRDYLDDLWVWWPCPTLRLMLIPYAGHPDYQAEWAIQPPDPEDD